MSLNRRLTLEMWKYYLPDYLDPDVVSFLEYGWPINFSSAVLAKSTFQNHSAVLKRLDIIDDYIKTELQNAAIIRPFQSNSFSSECFVSPFKLLQKTVRQDLDLFMI